MMPEGLRSGIDKTKGMPYRIDAVSNGKSRQKAAPSFNYRILTVR